MPSERFQVLKLKTVSCLPTSEADRSIAVANRTILRPHSAELGLGPALAIGSLLRGRTWPRSHTLPDQLQCARRTGNCFPRGGPPENRSWTPDRYLHRSLLVSMHTDGWDLFQRGTRSSLFGAELSFGESGAHRRTIIRAIRTGLPYLPIFQNMRIGLVMPRKSNT